METNTPGHDTEQFQIELQQSAKQLVDKLQSDKFEEASDLIHQMMGARDKHIFRSVGQLTRALHSAIVNFHVDAVVDDQGDSQVSEIRDASDRLNYVITLTQQAADKTMDKVEACAPIAMNLGQEAHRLKDEWARLKQRQMTKNEFIGLYTEVDTFLGQLGDGTDQLNKSLQDILLEQGFQDLTGQVLKKVIGLITDVERELVGLLRIAEQVEQVTGLADGEDQATEAVADNIVAEGPQIHAEKRNDVVSGQDDVDDLLSSLGF